jgi:predicted nucleotide-binding protein (sugar kinase/HSP70/actin superfamily)
MVVTFPHMGTMSIVLQTLFTAMGCEILTPPPITRRTMELGTQHSPETVCLPFKMTLGNFIEALEQGADTLVTCGGNGPCRLGYYAAVQQQILADLGYTFRMIAVEPNISGVYRQLKTIAPQTGWGKIYQAFQLAGAKMNLLDDVQREIHKIRPRALAGDLVEDVWRQAVAAIGPAATCQTLQALRGDLWDKLQTIKLNDKAAPLRVALVGEIYVMLEPFVNQNLERCLGSMGVEVFRTMSLSDYVRGHLLCRRSYTELYRQLTAMAEPYLGHYVGGHGLKSIAFTLLKKQQGYDGIIQVYPFTCMPEVVAKNILPRVSQDVDMPVLTLAYDEQTGEAGIRTRLEAFIDLLHYRKIKHWQSIPGTPV